MKTLLADLLAGKEIQVGDYTLFAYSDRTLAARHNNSLMTPAFKGNLAGLQRLLKAVDSAETPFPVFS